MAYYNLEVAETRKVLSDATAADRFGALGVFGKELGVTLTFDEQGGAPPYLFEEWYEGPHWINPKIPVYEA